MSRPTWAGVAPFCGANTAAASTKRVRTSHATSSSTVRKPGRRAQRLEGAEPAVGGRRPAEADDDPPGALLERPVDQLAGAGRRRLQRVVAVGAAGERQPAGPGHLDDGRALRRCRHAASTGAPSGPVTRDVRLGPPSTSSRPSPPSDIGTSSASWPSSQQALPTAAHASAAVAVPRNLSSAATTLMPERQARGPAQRRCQRSGPRARSRTLGIPIGR